MTSWRLFALTTRGGSIRSWKRKFFVEFVAPAADAAEQPPEPGIDIPRAPGSLAAQEQADEACPAEAHNGREHAGAVRRARGHDVRRADEQYQQDQPQHQSQRTAAPPGRSAEDQGQDGDHQGEGRPQQACPGGRPVCRSIAAEQGVQRHALPPIDLGRSAPGGPVAAVEMETRERQRLPVAAIDHASVFEVKQHIAAEIESQSPPARGEGGIILVEEHAAQAAAGPLDAIEPDRHAVAQIGELSRLQIIAEASVFQFLAQSL